MMTEDTPAPASPTPTPDTGVSRKAHWFSVAAFSTIALVALNTKIVGNIKDQKREVEWSIFAICIALGLSGLAVIANALVRTKFVGTAMEGGLAIMTFGFWASALPAIMKPGNNIATDNQGGIVNANLYFFSWAAFIGSLLVFFGYVVDARKKGKEASVDSPSMNRWPILCLSSFVAMVAAVRIYKSTNCDDFDNDFCDRTKLAVALGAFSALVALFWALIGACLRIPAILDAIISCILLAAWCFGVGYITFGGDKAPGQNIGNLFFFTWISFAVAAQLVATSLDEMFGKFFGRKDTEEKPQQAVQEDKGAAGIMKDEEVGTPVGTPENKDDLAPAVVEG